MSFLFVSSDFRCCCWRCYDAIGEQRPIAEGAFASQVELMRSKDKLRAYAERPFKDVPVSRKAVFGDRKRFENMFPLTV